MSSDDKIQKRSKFKRRKPPLSTKGRLNLETRLLKAALTSNLKEVRACIDGGVDANEYVGGEYAAIHIAAERGDLALGITLSTFPNLNYNPKTVHGFTPLILAILIRKRKFIKFLLKNGANPNLTDNMGRSPLHYVCRMSALELAFDLLKYKANVNVYDAFGNTPLSISLLDKNFIAMARLLVKKGAEVNPPERHTPIIIEYALICRSSEQIEGIEFLLKNGVDVNLQDPITKRTALHITAFTGYVPLARKLLEYGADADKTGRLGISPVEIALRHRNMEVYDLLMEHSSRKGSDSVDSRVQTMF